MIRIIAAIAVAALATGCSREPQPAPAAGTSIDVVELGAFEASRRMADGTLTSRALTEAYLARIAAVDDGGPMLNAVVELNPEPRRTRMHWMPNGVPATFAGLCTAFRYSSRTTSTSRGS